MPVVNLEGQKIEFEIRNSDRAKYARIDVDLKGITVVIPKDKPIDPEKFLREKSEWVLEKYNKINDYWARVPDRKFKDGGKFPYLGEDYTIKLSENGSSGFKDGQILISEDKAEQKGTKEIIEEMYRDKVREKIKGIIDEYSDQIDEDYNKLYIRNQKTKWASCSSKKNLSFNWRLLMAPEKVIEYVVVHELVHLEESNHSTKFWYRVSEILPDYKERRKWLKENSPELVFSGEDLL